MTHYLKNAVVLLTVFLVTAVVAIPFYFIPAAVLPGFEDPWVAITCVAAALFAAYFLRVLANRFLFEKPCNAKVQLLGGVRLGGRMAAAFTGRSASWPFAKLSASTERLRIETPFGKYVWRWQDVRLTGGTLGRWKIEAATAPIEITFYAPPWAARAAKVQLAALGYLA